MTQEYRPEYKLLNRSSIQMAKYGIALGGIIGPLYVLAMIFFPLEDTSYRAISAFLGLFFGSVIGAVLGAIYGVGLASIFFYYPPSDSPLYRAIFLFAMFIVGMLGFSRFVFVIFEEPIMNVASVLAGLATAYASYLFLHWYQNEYALLMEQFEKKKKSKNDDLPL